MTNLTGEMMRYGDFTFSLSTAAYEEMERTTDWRWHEQERVGRRSALQFLGPGVDEIRLSGVIFTHYNPGDGTPQALTSAVGMGQLDKIRKAGDAGVPRMLVSGRGRVFGMYCLTTMQERASVFLRDGTPKQQEFDITLQAYGEDGAGVSGIIRAGLSLLAGTLSGGIAKIIDTAKSALIGAGLSNAASTTAGAVLDALPSAGLLSKDLLGAVTANLVQQVGILPQSVAKPVDWLTLMAADYGDSVGNIAAEVTSLGTYMQGIAKDGQQAFAVAQAAYKTAKDGSSDVDDFIQGFQWMQTELGLPGLSSRLDAQGVDLQEAFDLAPAEANKTDVAWATLVKLYQSNPGVLSTVVPNSSARVVVQSFATRFSAYTDYQRSYNEHDLYV